MQPYRVWLVTRRGNYNKLLLCNIDVISCYANQKVAYRILLRKSPRSLLRSVVDKNMAKVQDVADYAVQKSEGVDLPSSHNTAILTQGGRPDEKRLAKIRISVGVNCRSLNVLFVCLSRSFKTCFKLMTMCFTFLHLISVRQF
jgi:hypothetical protein